MTSPIVCGVDGSAPSLAAARLGQSLARASGRPVHYVYVARPAAEADALRALRTAHRRLAETVGKDAPLRVRPGAPAEQLVEAARQASLIVLGTRARNPLQRAIGCSLSTAVARASAVPVVVVPAQPTDVPPSPAAERALVCGIRDHDDMACAATSAVMARELDLRLTLVHVVTRPRGRVRSADEQVAIRMLDEIACAIAPTAPAVCRTLVVRGHVGRELDRAAAAEGAMLVALGQSRRRVRGSALGRRSAGFLIRHGNRAVVVSPTAERALSGARPPSDSGRRHVRSNQPL